jgi:predicted ABC-type exoprotein transport system permease subunit
MLIVFDRRFLFGIMVGVGGVYAYHRWVKPIPTKAAN